MLCWGLSTDVALLGRGGTKEAENFPSSGTGDRGAKGVRRESLSPHFFFSCFSRSYKNLSGVLLGSSAPQTLKYCMKGCLRWYHAYHPYVELGLKWLFFAYSRWDQSDYLKKEENPHVPILCSAQYTQRPWGGTNLLTLSWCTKVSSSLFYFSCVF